MGYIIKLMTSPTERETARAARRAEDGKSLDATEVAALLASRGDLLDRLTAVARRVRDAGLAEADRSGVITYSRKVFVPLTRLCRDRCHYCTFVTVPGKLSAEGKDPFLSPDEVLEIARRGAAMGCKEALFTLGDRPEGRWPEAQAWLEAAGYESTLEYVRAMAVRVLEETGLLPHLNPGGFTEFVPLPFVHQSSPIYLAGVAHPGPTIRDNRAVHAVARIMLSGLIDNIQCSWVKLGPAVCAGVLNGGANDLGGTLMEETISRMAGSPYGSRKSAGELEQMAALAGRPAVQRTTLYQNPGEGVLS